MKITKQLPNTFKDMKTGDVFLINNNLYLKIVSTKEYNVLRLEDYLLDYVYDDAYVTSLDSELVVK